MIKTLSDIFIVPDYDNAKITVKFSKPPHNKDIKWSIMDGSIVFSKGISKLSSNSDPDFDIDMSNYIPWSPETPHLYTIKIETSFDEKITETFGMRKFSIIGNQIYLNNKPLYIRGYIRGRDAHEHPNFLGISNKKFYEKNIIAAKKFGFNFVRFHSRVPDKEFFQAADELGMLIQIELRNYDDTQHNNFLTDQGLMLNKQKWIDTIQTFRNHPSLMVYCMGCEMPGSGTAPYTLEVYNLVKSMDTTRLFLDTCGRGEFDRTTSDIEVQHMSYFYPYGKNYNMFEDCNQWSVNGSIHGLELETNSSGLKIKRSLSTKIPVIAHEICHYAALRDINKMEKNFQLNGMEKPWWVDEIKKLISLKKLENDYPQMLSASKHFQAISWKLCLEAARRSRTICGFQLLQLSDTDKYENSNGILDCFDDPQNLIPDDFRKFNDATVILADLPRRTYFEKEKITIPVILSHYNADITGYADLEFNLIDSCNNKSVISGKMVKFNMSKYGRYEICQIELYLPATDSANALVLNLKLSNDAKTFSIENSWPIWVYPDKPQNIKPISCTIQLDDVNISYRYPQITSAGSIDDPQKLIIANHFSKGLMEHLSAGGDVLLLYRVPETRRRKIKAYKEKYYLPATWDRFKPTIWDRGTNCGGFVRPNDVLTKFPHKGVIDFQFSSLIDDCDKITLDDFPCQIEPIIQGVDKAARDRFDVHTYNLGTLQPKWTLRTFGYMFELKVGKGRLFITGFNFTKLAQNQPEVCAMFESIINYITSDKFNPKAFITPDELEKYLLQKGSESRIKERKMTQFWQLDEEPLESELYWKQAEEYINSQD